MEILIVVVAVLIVWYFGHTIRKVVEVGEDLAIRRLDRIQAEQKVATAEFYSKLDIDAEMVKSASSNKQKLDKLNI
jgi:hypothetical protein